MSDGKYTFEAFGESGNTIFSSTVLSWDDVSALLRAVTLQPQICAANVWDGDRQVLYYAADGMEL